MKRAIDAHYENNCAFIAGICFSLRQDQTPSRRAYDFNRNMLLRKCQYYY